MDSWVPLFLGITPLPAGLGAARLPAYVWLFVTGHRMKLPSYVRVFPGLLIRSPSTRCSGWSRNVLIYLAPNCRVSGVWFCD